MKIIAYGGWYGSGNIGDDAILIGIRNIFRKVRPEIGIVALSTNPSQTNSVCKVNSIHLKGPLEFLTSPKHYMDEFSTADGCIITGGTPFYDYDHVSRILHHWLTKKTCDSFIFGVGAKKINSIVGKKTISHILTDALRISVRDLNSFETLKKLTDKEVVLTGDSAFFLESSPKSGVLHRLSNFNIDFDKEVVIFCPRALSLHYKKSYHDPVTEKLVEEIRISQAKLIRLLNHGGYQVAFLPMHDSSMDNDLSEIKSIKHLSCLEIPILPKMHPCDVAAVLGSASLVVGMRLHSLIISVSQNVPAVTLGYDEKIHGFMEMMELGNYVSSPGNLSSATIEALDKRDDLREIIYERCFDSKAKIIEEAKKISELL